MKFSVLIPVYNTEKYLEECLQSVLNQTFQNFEIVIVDDGSTDNSGAICDKYQGDFPDKIKVVHKENQGLISARRVGINNAEGDYCIFVDSDDYVKKELLEEIGKILSVNSEIDVLIYSFSYFKNGKYEKDFHRIADDYSIWTEKNKSDLYKKLLFSHDITPMWIKAIKTSLLKSDETDYSIYYGKNMGEDILQSLDIITRAKRIKYFYLPLYCYNYNDSSISRSFSSELIQEKNMAHIYQLIEQRYLPIWDLNDNENQQKLYATCFDSCMYLFFHYYEKSMDKTSVLQFDWNSFLVQKNTDMYFAYVNPVYYKVFCWWKEGAFSRIRFFFVKKKFYNIYKRLKSSIKK